MIIVFLYDCYYTNPKGKITRRGFKGIFRRILYPPVCSSCGLAILISNLIPRKRLAYYMEREAVTAKKRKQKGAVENAMRIMS